MEIEEQLTHLPLARTAANPDFESPSSTPSDDTDKAEMMRKIGFAVLAFLLWMASILLIVIVPAIFLFPYLSSQGISISDSEQFTEFAKTDPTAVILQVAAIIPAHILTVLIAWLVVTRSRTFSFRKTVGWESGGIKWWHYVAMLLVFFALVAIVGSYFPEQENDLIRMLKTSKYAVYIVALVATVTAPLVEEVIYRGVLYSTFERALGVPAAFALVTFLFAVVHVPQYYPSYSTIFLLALLSIMLTALRVRSKNLLPCIILHTLFNGAQSVFLVLGAMTDNLDLPSAQAASVHILK